ncbi:uncharacterized protein LOC144157837 [Haemaphysalis longicornis]
MSPSADDGLGSDASRVPVGVSLLLPGLGQRPSQGLACLQSLAAPCHHHPAPAANCCHHPGHHRGGPGRARRGPVRPVCPGPPARSCPAEHRCGCPARALVVALCTTELTLRELQAGLDHCPKRRSAPGVDGVTYQMLRNLAVTHLGPLLLLFNRASTTGILPAAWLVGVVSPILKAGKPPSEPESYRSVSLTSTAGKVLQARTNPGPGARGPGAPAVDRRPAGSVPGAAERLQAAPLHC